MSGGARVLDRARGRLFGAVGRLAAAQALARRRALRLAVVGAAVVLAAFAGVALVPIVMLAVAPVVLGVPHVAADVRYLVVRRSVLARRAWLPLAVAAIACSVAAALGSLRLMVGAGFAGVALAAALADGGARSSARRALVTAVVLALGAGAVMAPRTAALAMAQGHNVVAVALALWLVRDKLPHAWLPAVLFAGGVAAIAAGALDAPLGAALARSGQTGALFASAVAPPAASSLVVVRAVGIFAFAQAVHYGAWLRLVPDGERAGERPIGYRHSLALLRDDFGRAAPLVIMLSVALPLAACVALADVRAGYFTLAAFHGYLELAFVAAALAR